MFEWKKKAKKMQRKPLSQQGKKQQSNFSRTLTKILRHTGKKEGLKFREDGYCKVEDILKHKGVSKFQCDEYDVRFTVENCDKQRMSLSEIDGELFIKANQGHSIKFEELELTPIKSVEDVPRAVHGTYYKSWPFIQKDGLKTMGRTHIHFAVGEYGSKDVISGMRKTCEVLIYLDIQKCLDDGIPLEISPNKVVLSIGDKNGSILPKYFSKVVDLATGKDVEFDK